MQPGSYRGTVVVEIFQRQVKVSHTLTHQIDELSPLQNHFSTEFLLRLTLSETFCAGKYSGIPKKHIKQAVIVFGASARGLNYKKWQRKAVANWEQNPCLMYLLIY